MSASPTPMTSATDEIVFGSELADLEAIFEPGVQLATAPVHLGPEISEHLSPGRLGWQWKQVVEVDEESQPDLKRLRSLEVSSNPGGEALRAATAEVLELVALLFGAVALGVRVANATSPPCPRYHVDRVAVRGVLTLVGRGSHYLLGHEVDRSKLGHGAGGLADEDSGLILAGAQPRSLEAGHLCLFKGEAWSSNAGKGLVHRSPPEDGNPRWILTVDLVE